MVDYKIVCSMCGDVGFQDKLFRCTKCFNRFQHSYCSNYYSESSSEAIEVCDWCSMSEEKSSRHICSGSSRKSSGGGNEKEAGRGNRSEYSGERIKQHDREEVAAERVKTPSGTPSPRPSTRRYKLLKDVMC